jgi:hypothetical protein
MHRFINPLPIRIGLAAALIVTVAGWASGQAFKPFESNRITDEQWQLYFLEVKGSEGKEVHELWDQHLIVFSDEAQATTWVFTQMGHPAHPGWITRRIVGEGADASIQQIGFYVDKVSAFAVFFDQYLALNKEAESP